MSEYSIVRDREPIAHWPPGGRTLFLQIIGELREGITLRVTVVAGYAFISARKHDRLKKHAVNLVRVLNCETDDVTEPVVVEAVDYGNLERGSHSGRSDVF